MQLVLGVDVVTAGGGGGGGDCLKLRGCGGGGETMLCLFGVFYNHSHSLLLTSH